MAKLYRVELATLKTWRSGSKRFVQGAPQYLNEQAAKPFMNDSTFQVTPIDSKEQEKELIAKGVVEAAPQGEQPRLSEDLKEDADREALEETPKAKKQFLKKAAKPEANQEA
jgi:hypothetical protein